MIKHKEILICDICRRKVKSNYLKKSHYIIYLLAFVSYSILEWVVEFNNKFSDEVICKECSKSFSKWIRKRRLTKKENKE